MNTIQSLSRLFKGVFLVLLVGWPIVVTLVWWADLSFLDYLGVNLPNFLPDGVYNAIMVPLTNSIKLWGYLISFIPVGVSMVTCWLFVKLFSCYERGEVFTFQSIGYLKKIGLVLIVGVFLTAIYQVLITLAMTIHNPVGHRLIQVGISMGMVRDLITAGLVFLIGHIMKEGLKVREEQALTV